MKKGVKEIQHLWGKMSQNMEQLSKHRREFKKINNLRKEKTKVCWIERRPRIQPRSWNLTRYTSFLEQNTGSP